MLLTGSRTAPPGWESLDSGPGRPSPLSGGEIWVQTSNPTPTTLFIGTPLTPYNPSSRLITSQAPRRDRPMAASKSLWEGGQLEHPKTGLWFPTPREEARSVKATCLLTQGLEAASEGSGDPLKPHPLPEG